MFIHPTVDGHLSVWAIMNIVITNIIHIFWYTVVPISFYLGVEFLGISFNRYCPSDFQNDFMLPRAMYEDFLTILGIASLINLSRAGGHVVLSH